MKSLLAIFVLVFCSNTNATVEFKLDVAISGLSFFGTTYNEIEGDLVLIDRYVSFNGAIFATGARFPITGTCYITGFFEDELFCDLKYGYVTLSLSLDVDSFAGTVEARDGSGILIDQGSAFITRADLI